jgi:hypothetical protein
VLSLGWERNGTDVAPKKAAGDDRDQLFCLVAIAIENARDMLSGGSDMTRLPLVLYVQVSRAK